MKQNINDELTKMIKPILYRPYNNTRYKVLKGNKRNIPIARRRKRNIVLVIQNKNNLL